MNLITSKTPLPEDGDSLDDFLGPRTSETRAPVTPPASYEPKDFSEPCPKCRGTGRFTGWSGRSFGQCFTCKGAGKKVFKTSRETRQRNKEGAEARQARKEAATIEDFKVAHPDVWAWMDGSTFDFAVSLRGSLVKFGSLTENQLAAARRSIEKLTAAKAASVQRVTSAPVIAIDKIEQAFATAFSNGAKKPKLRIAGFTFSPAPKTSRNAGSIYVKQDGQYLGKVSSGKFLCTRECGDERRDQVLTVAADPKTAAIAHGLKMGNCACCGRDLTDPESIAAGIGPVCAAKYGW